MSYVPLYRKYRPQTLEEVVGQEHIKKALANAIELNKISHAYLFTGPRGTGKTSTARIFAKSLNCKEGPTVKPCGVCENCIDITNSTPMDVIEIDAASNRKVEDAQNILEKVMYAPVNSRYKIYIIDEVHMLSTTAFNALLKTLEEPPENVIFILATTEVHKVLDTIKSRCQRFDFKRITTADIVKHLRNIADKEKINITDDALNTIAKNSAGGMRDSIALLDQLSILGSKDEITTDDINNLLGRLSFDILHSLADKILNSDIPGAVELLENIYNSGNEPVQILNNLTDYLRNLLVVKNCSKDAVFELTQLNAEQAKLLSLQAENIETQQIVSLIDKSAEYIKETKLTNNPHLWLEVAIIDLANLTENTKLAQLQERILRLEGGNTEPARIYSYKAPEIPKSVPTQAVKEEVKQEIKQEKSEKIEPKAEIKNETKSESFSPMPKSKHVDENDISILWGKLLNSIKSTPTRALLNQWAVPIKISAEETVIAVKNEMFLNKVQSSIQTITDSVNEIFSQTNSSVNVRLLQSSDNEVKPAAPAKPKPSPYIPPKNETEEIQQEIEQEIEETKSEKQPEIKMSDELMMYSDNVNMILDVFDGKIIK